jgi:hypothetical protein
MALTGVAAAFAGGAAAELGLAAPTPTASCTVVQVDGTNYEATVTWSGISLVSLELLAGSTPLSQSVFGHPTRKGSVTLTVTSAPTVAQLTGKSLGLKTPCN